MKVLILEIQKKNKSFQYLYNFPIIELTQKKLNYYNKMNWVVIKHPDICKLEDSQVTYIRERFSVFNFGIIDDTKIINLLKNFVIYSIEKNNYNLTTISTWNTPIQNIIYFINDNYSDVEQLVFIDKDKVFEKYLNFVSQLGYNINKTFTRVNGEMELNKYEGKGLYFKIFHLFYEFIVDMTTIETKQKEFDKDIWDIRNLNIEVKINTSRPRFILNFSKIKQKSIKFLSKKYIYERLQKVAFDTCLKNLRAISNFSKFLDDYFPKIKKLTDLDRNIIENFLGYVEIQNWCDNTKRTKIGDVKTFIEYVKLRNWKETPNVKLFINTDLSCPPKKIPEYIEDIVLEQLNENLEHLPLMVSRMVFVIQQIGMRVNELCKLEKNNLKTDYSGNHYIKYFQDKTKNYNRVPINTELAQVLKASIHDSNNKFGTENKYIFSVNKNKPYPQESFSYYLNKLSYDRNIVDSHGNKFRFKSHRFRATVATRMLNGGLELNVVRRLLGQKSMKSVKVYAKLFNNTITEAIKPVTIYHNKLINNIGNKDIIRSFNEEDGYNTPLSNGECEKPLSEGACVHANACYTCSMFKPDKKHLKIYEAQLQKAKSNLAISKKNKFKRLEQVNKELVNNLENIINQIEEI